MDGQTPYEGRLEMCVNDLWVSVCADNWDRNHVAVVCRQLGYNTSTFEVCILLHPNIKKMHCCCTASHVLREYGGSYSVISNNISCTGTEGKLADCILPGFGIENTQVGNSSSCERNSTAGVTCITGLGKYAVKFRSSLGLHVYFVIILRFKDWWWCSKWNCGSSHRITVFCDSCYPHCHCNYSEVEKELVCEVTML